MMRFLSMLQPVCQIAHTRAFWDGEVASARPQAPTSMLCRSHGVRLREGQVNGGGRKCGVGASPVCVHDGTTKNKNK